MTVELGYRTTDPRVIAWAHKRLALEQKSHQLRLDFMFKVGVQSLRIIWQPHRGSVITGITPNELDRFDLPEGWRFDSRRHLIVPALRTEAGQRVSAELAALTIAAVDSQVAALGLAHSVRIPIEPGSSSVYYPQLDLDRLDEGAVYQYWGTGVAAESAEAASGADGAPKWTELTRAELRNLLAETEAAA